MQATIASVLHRYIVALQYQDFRWIWLSSMGGQSAYWALIVARGIYVLDETGSSTQVGITTFVAMAPRFLLPPLAGYLADRFDRRTVLATAYVLQLLQALVLVALALGGVLEVWHVVVLALLNGSFRTFQMTATQTLIPNVVPREHWLNAIAMNQVSLQGSRLVGPALITPALLLYDVSIAFLVSTTFYVLGIAGVMAIRTRSTGELTRGSSIGASLWAALRYAWADPQLRALFILLALHCSMSMSFESILPVIARDELGDVDLSAYLMMGVGAGAVVALIGIAGVRSASGRGKLLFLTGVVSGASLLLLAASGSTTVALLGAAAMGGSQAAFMAIGGAMVQSLAPDGMRGRISGLNQINIGGTMAVMNLVNGFAADEFGAPIVLLVLGLGFTAAAVASLAFGTVRGIYRGSIAVPVRAAA